MVKYLLFTDTMSPYANEYVYHTPAQIEISDHQKGPIFENIKAKDAYRVLTERFVAIPFCCYAQSMLFP